MADDTKPDAAAVAPAADTKPTDTKPATDEITSVFEPIDPNAPQAGYDQTTGEFRV